LFNVNSTVRQGGKADVLLFAEDFTIREMLKKGEGTNRPILGFFVGLRVFLVLQNRLGIGSSPVVRLALE
jgi:hypothetical protein